MRDGQNVIKLMVVNLDIAIIRNQSELMMNMKIKSYMKTLKLKDIVNIKFRLRLKSSPLTLTRFSIILRNQMKLEINKNNNLKRKLLMEKLFVKIKMESHREVMLCVMLIIAIEDYYNKPI